MKFKVAFYINSIHDGGAERVIVNLAGQFANHGYETMLITSFVDQEFEYKLNPKVKRFSLEGRELKQGKINRNLSRIIKLRRLLRREKPDVLIAFMMEPSVRAIMASQGLNVKTIVSVRNDPERIFIGKKGKFIKNVIYPMADGCVFQTKQAQSAFSKRFQKKSTVILNAVKKDFFEVERTPEKNLIVACGRLEKQKNYPLLINAMERVVNEKPSAYLEIYGQGSCEEELKALVRKKHLEKNIFFKGQSNNVPEVLSRASIYVMSSDYEGLPNSLMEALAAGVPCVSTDCPCGGPRELITNNLNGSLCQVGNVCDMSKKILGLLNASDKMKGFSGNAKDKSKYYKEKIVSHKWEKYIYKKK